MQGPLSICLAKETSRAALCSLSPPTLAYGFVPLATMPVEIVVAWRRRWWGNFQRWRLVLSPVSSFGCGFFSASLQQWVLNILQHTYMLPLEVVGPGGTLSVLLFITSYWGDANRRRQWWRLHIVATSSTFGTSGSRNGGGTSIYVRCWIFSVIITFIQPFLYFGLFFRKCKHFVSFFVQLLSFFTWCPVKKNLYVCTLYLKIVPLFPTFKNASYFIRKNENNYLYAYMVQIIPRKLLIFYWSTGTVVE